MPAYLIVRLEVTDWDQYRKYTSATPAVIKQFGGRFIVRGGQMETLEGRPETRRVVVIEFPSFERVKEFFNSPEYTEVKKLREGAAIGEFLAIEGYAG
jgi:uncharacterized protein (DUF1330 family)